MADYVIARDGLPALPIKPHTLEKLNAIQRYVDQFTKSMKLTGSDSGFRGFAERNYIDLLSGPGLCVVQGTSREVQGSPLVALSTEYPFSHYYFVDANPDAIVALKKRAATLSGSASANIRYFVGDCNQQVHQVLGHIDKKLSINLAVIDGYGVECHWSTIKALASCRRMDLIILFPQGMSINRNLRQWIDKQGNALDDFFGTHEWRPIYDAKCGQPKQCIRDFLDLYQQNLRTLRYPQPNQVGEFLVRAQKGQKLYYLVFASRHRLGQRFWKQATDKSSAGQKRLFD